MKKYFSLLVVLSVVITTGVSHAEEKKTDPHQLFYAANHDYEARDYQKAAEEYMAILDAGFESGSLYYNIGNSFLKMGMLGRAIVYYEKAKRLIPHDSDLKANLAYARSLVENAADGAHRNVVAGAINAIFEQYSLRAVIFSATLLYLILILLVGTTLMKPFLGRRLRVVVLTVTALFVVNLSALAIRYFNERILKHGVVVQKDAEGKYEPIEKSTTYYSLREGGDVIILSTRNGWRRVKRPDGKISWVKKETIEEI